MYNGLGNQLCSLQLLAGMSALYPDTEIKTIYPVASRWKIQDPQEYQVETTYWDKNYFKSENPSLLDFLDYSPRNNVVFYPNDRFITDRVSCKIHHCQYSFLPCSPASDLDVKQFGWPKTQIFLDPYKENVFTYALSWYSTFFFNRTPEMEKELGSIRFKKEYLDLADRISNDLGSFNGAHVRIMKDHHYQFSFSDNILSSGLGSVTNPELPLMVSVDDWNHELILKNKGQFILAHEHILENYYDSFKGLEFQNRVSLALLSMLVMIRSSSFVGTPLSTYTSYIQQQRCQLWTEEWKFFGSKFSKYNKDHTPYSWLSTPLGHPMSWEREWEECRLKND